MWNNAKESPVKEEKIEIKRGKLKWPEDKMKFVKKWKQRYFVFCEIIKGPSRWLKLLYYKNKVAYTRSDLPMGYIDITVADDITIMGSDMDRRKHIINISTPGKECSLLAPSCEEMYLWILALRAYRFNDESKIPWVSQRSNSMLPSNVECPIGEVAGATPEGIRPPLPTPDEMNPPMSPTYASLPRKSDYALYVSNEKLRRKFLYCEDCLQKRDSYIAPEDYYPVMPTLKPPEVLGSPTTPKPRALSASDLRDDNIYDEISSSPFDPSRVSEPTENDYPYGNVITSMSPRNRPESNSSCSSDTESFPSGGSVEASRRKLSVPKIKVDNEETKVAEAGFISSAKGNSRANSPSFGSYVMMRPPSSKEETKKMPPRITPSPTQESSPRSTHKLGKTLSVPCNLDLTPTIPSQQTVVRASTMCLPTVCETSAQRNRDTSNSISIVQSQASQERSLAHSSTAVKDSSPNRTVAIPKPLREQPETPPNKPPRSKAQTPHHELTHDMSPMYVNRTPHDEFPQSQSSTALHRPSSGQPVQPPNEMKIHHCSNLTNEEDGKEIVDGVQNVGKEFSIEDSLHAAPGGARVKNQYVTDHSVGWGARMLVRNSSTLIEKAVDEKMEGGDQGLNDHNSNIRLSRMFEKLEFVHIADV